MGESYLVLKNYHERIIHNHIGFTTIVLPLYHRYNMQFYSRGVFSTARCSSHSVNHALLITGYGSYNGRDYWLAKNRYIAMTLYKTVSTAP